MKKNPYNHKYERERESKDSGKVPLFIAHTYKIHSYIHIFGKTR